MELPSGLKPGLWGAAAGAIAVTIVGFSYLGWTTAVTSEKHAQETADTAVVAALLPFCVTKRSRSQPDHARKVTGGTILIFRHDIVMKAGWREAMGGMIWRVPAPISCT